MLLGVVLSRAAFLGALSALSASNQEALLPLDSGPFFIQQDYTDINSLLSGQSLSTRLAVSRILQQDPSLAGPLIRLAFHDAATFDGNGRGGGPNASIRYEVEWSENRGITRPLQVVQDVYNNATDQHSLSLADTIALAGAQAVENAGGPNIPIKLGRVDATVADSHFIQHVTRGSTERSVVTRTLPSPALYSVGLRLYFKRLGLSESEFVALLGIHSLGRHVSLLGMSKECLRNLTQTCLEEAPTLLPFVTSSVDKFDNSYFKYLLKWYNREIEFARSTLWH